VNRGMAPDCRASTASTLSCRPKCSYVVTFFMRAFSTEKSTKGSLANERNINASLLAKALINGSEPSLRVYLILKLQTKLDASCSSAMTLSYITVHRYVGTS